VAEQFRVERDFFFNRRVFREREFEASENFQQRTNAHFGTGAVAIGFREIDRIGFV